jgi:pimeloyl-ACP methyl ester carboxylesterase
MKRLAVNGVEIAYVDEGKGPGIIAAHCSSASHKEWLPLIEALKSDWRVLAPDFIGYGQSEPWPATEPFSIEADVEYCRRSPEGEGPAPSRRPLLRRRARARSGADPRVSR